jgi:secondary thiamine-phosphate synthase enzyme
VKHTLLTLPPHPRGLYNITTDIAAVVASSVGDGMCHVFIRHTSASLIIQENADPDVLHDLEAFFSRLVPDGDPLFRHIDEGPDDMPAHVRGALTQTTLTIPVRDGRLMLGTWQGIFLWEHRSSARPRSIIVTIDE